MEERRGIWICNCGSSPMTQQIKNPPAIQEMQEMWVLSLGQEDSLEEEMATHSSIFAWKISWAEEPKGYISWGHKKSDMTEHTAYSI